MAVPAPDAALIAAQRFGAVIVATGASGNAMRFQPALSAIVTDSVGPSEIGAKLSLAAPTVVVMRPISCVPANAVIVSDVVSS
jgi:hypothetical protein